MFITIQVEGSLLDKLLNYVRKHKIWYRVYRNRVYDIKVSPEDRAQLIRNRELRGDMNPSRAWESCRSFVEAWDWDSMGRGPCAKTNYELEKNGNTAPRGKGWMRVSPSDSQPVRVAGECANSKMLDYISCPMWCTKYEPTNVEGVIHVLDQISQVHEKRAQAIYSEIESLRNAEKGYEEAIRDGSIFSREVGGTIMVSPNKDESQQP